MIKTFHNMMKEVESNIYQFTNNSIEEEKVMKKVNERFIKKPMSIDKHVIKNIGKMHHQMNSILNKSYKHVQNYKNT